MKCTVILVLALVLADSVAAHKAPTHKHAQLIPIPAYRQPYGEAGAQASRQAAKAFLATFDEAARDQFMFTLNAAERAGWSNLPAGIVDRTGIAVAELSDVQRDLLFDFLASSLSEEGYRKVMDIMAAEAFLSNDRRARRLKWDPQNYWISFYGTPSTDTPWGWQYGGHHLVLNISVENNRVETMSPSFVGTEPAVFSLNGVDYVSMVDMHRAGYAVYSALDAEQRAVADAERVPRDVQTGPGKDGAIPPVIGISASKLRNEQRALMLSAIRKWVAIQPSENAVPRMAQIESELDQTHFAWIGDSTLNTPAYMRIQGPTLIIELLSTGGNVGENASGKGHYHSIYRNPAMEYGG